MTQSMLFVILAVWAILVGLFLTDRYLIKKTVAPRFGTYAVLLHHAFNVLAILMMMGGIYLLLLHGKAWIILAFGIGLLWPGLPIAMNYVMDHQVFSEYWDEVATENNFILDGKIWLSVIISLVITLLMIFWTYYS